MKNKKNIISAVILILLAAGIIYRFAMTSDEVIAYETRPTVSAETPKTGDITLYTDLTGTVEPQSKASVMPKMGGEVLEVYFKAGDNVEAGQALCKIDSDSLTALKISVDSAAIALSDSRNTLSRTTALFDTGAVSQQALEQAQNAAKSAQLSYEAAKNQYDLQLEYTTVKSPLSGKIESRNVEPHDYVGTNTEICLISGQAQNQIKFGVTEKILLNMQTGDKVTVEKNGLEYEGSVAEISSMVNSSTGLYDVKAVLSDAAGLTTGTRVKLTVIMSKAEQVMTVPVDAVNYNNGLPFVYCYENGTAKKTEIETGIYDSERIEIKTGLTNDSKIITSWSNELADGAEVLLEQQAAESGEESSEAPAVTDQKAGDLNG
ncbi:efflux RND transporter periplasmic adaptor subunit [Lachnospiraceae bacterium 54-53]